MNEILPSNVEHVRKMCGLYARTYSYYVVKASSTSMVDAGSHHHSSSKKLFTRILNIFNRIGIRIYDDIHLEDVQQSNNMIAYSYLGYKRHFLLLTFK